MPHKKVLALSGAFALALAVVCASALAASRAPAVIVRIEGIKKLLLDTSVKPHAPVRKGGAPAGACPATSAAGALQAATHGRFVATYDASLKDLEITSILGETHSFSSPNFWELFVNNKPASLGACHIKLHKGDHILFAAVPDKGTAYPLVIRAPHTATVGKSFQVKVIAYKSHAVPAAGISVQIGSLAEKTGKKGTVRLTEATTGALVIGAHGKGYVRAAPVTVRVVG